MNSRYVATSTSPPSECDNSKLRRVRLPVVDLAADNAAAQLASACSQVGFQCIINHGVDLECARSVENLENFFRTSSPKRKHSVRRPARGYGPGLQLTEHMEAEVYDTVEGAYGTYAREDYVYVNPEIGARKVRARSSDAHNALHQHPQHTRTAAHSSFISSTCSPPIIPLFPARDLPALVERPPALLARPAPPSPRRPSATPTTPARAARFGTRTATTAPPTSPSDRCRMLITQPWRPWASG